MKAIVPGLAFLLGMMVGWLSLRVLIKTDQPEPEEIENLLDAQGAIKQLPFPRLINQVTGHAVLPWNESDPACVRMANVLREAGEEVITFLNRPDSPARQKRRINEVSALVEDQLRTTIDRQEGMRCEVPVNRRAGYPDLQVTDEATGRVFYLDPKLYEARHERSTLRTFYYQPNRTTSKVTSDAHHLLIGFRHDGETGAWTFDHWRVVDLASFQIGLKVEFQGSNRDLYESAREVVSR